MMTENVPILDQLLAWCRQALGPVEPADDYRKSHPGAPVVTQRLRLGARDCFLKTHRHPQFWEAEVHAYENWATAFGRSAPELLAVRDEAPRAIVVSALPGTVAQDLSLTLQQERALWRDAGQALAPLHELAVGEFFGPCHRDGTPAGDAIIVARQFIVAQLQQAADRGRRLGYLGKREWDIVQAGIGLSAAFEGETPLPCHRDYCPANWLVDGNGVWRGVVDFEFAQWDVRAADFARFPNWEWIDRPDLVAAFFEGYGALTPMQEQQRLVALVRYALTAIVWGADNAYHGFADEGRVALRHLARLL